MSNEKYDVVIVGGGAAGISVAASLLKRQKRLNIAIVDPADQHYYQPGFTLVGRGVFRIEDMSRPMASLIPNGVTRVRKAVTGFDPDANAVTLDDGATLNYDRLVVCPGLKLDWAAIEGLEETLGKHGVTSNYHPDHANYTWELVQNLKSGKAIFTQPPMPIKCAGAPQKAMYLSADQWQRSNVLNSISIEFCNAGAALFGVKDFVPALEGYVQRYGIDLRFSHNLVKVDGPGKTAWFEVKDDEGNTKQVEKSFDMLHVCPPQTAPDFVRSSPLADDTGWVNVDQTTLRHKQYDNVWSLGDVTNAPNAKTAAAARVQAPIVAANMVADIRGDSGICSYNGYGACPLTVEKGKVVLAEFGYGGKLLPSLPTWLVPGTKPTRLAWIMKEKVMPPLYWHGMLKGHEIMVRPKVMLNKS
ncbi:MAG: FAD-dependent oxidoreductase [Pseudomonadota bacterium]